MKSCRQENACCSDFFNILYTDGFIGWNFISMITVIRRNYRRNKEGIKQFNFLPFLNKPAKLFCIVF